jgi:tetratricopeptide (TPR) repeat protein
MELARLLDQRERPIEALEQYEELAATDENDPVPWRAAAELLARRGDTKKASEAWSEVLRLVPDDPDAKRGLDHLAEAPMVMAPSSPMGLTATADEPDADPTPPAAAPPPAAQAPRGPIEQWGFDPERRPAVPPR